MSVKFTKKQIKKIILEEHRKLLSEIKFNSITTAIKTLKSDAVSLAMKLGQLQTLSKLLSKTEIDKMVVIIKKADSTPLAKNKFVTKLRELENVLDDFLTNPNLDDASKALLQNTKTKAVTARKAAEKAAETTALAIPKKPGALATTTKKGGALATTGKAGGTALATTAKGSEEVVKAASKYRNLYRLVGAVGGATLISYLMGVLDDESEANAQDVDCMEEAAAYLGIPVQQFALELGDPAKGPGLLALLQVSQPPMLPFNPACLTKITQMIQVAPTPTPGPTPVPGGTNYAAQQQGQFGRCRTYAVMVTKGSSNMAKAFVKDMMHLQRTLVELGYNLGTFGPNGDGVDGKYGGSKSMTRKAVQALQRSVGLTGRKADGVWGKGTSTAIEASVKKTQSNKIYDAINKTLIGPPSKCAGGQTGDQTPDFGNVKTTDAVRAYMFVYRTIFGRVKDYLKFKNVKGEKNKMARTMLEPFLPELRPVSMNYRIKGKSYSTGNPKLGQALMGFLSALKGQASKAEQTLGINTLPDYEPTKDTHNIVRIITKASDTYLDSVLEESKSYNLDFSKYSKLWK